MARQSLNIAILKITNPPDNVEFHRTCPGVKHSEISQHNISDTQNNWTARQYGDMLAGFYYGYLLGMIPSSLCSQYIGFYPTMTFSGFMNGILSILYPLAIGHSYKMGNYIFNNSISDQNFDFITKGFFPNVQNCYQKFDCRPKISQKISKCRILTIIFDL